MSNKKIGSEVWTLIQVNKLKALFVEKNLTQQNVASYLGITEVTMSRKMQKGVFDSEEIYKMIRLLDIKNPAEIFFAEKVNW